MNTYLYSTYKYIKYYLPSIIGCRPMVWIASNNPSCYQGDFPKTPVGQVEKTAQPYRCWQPIWLFRFDTVLFAYDVSSWRYYFESTQSTYFSIPHNDIWVSYMNILQYLNLGMCICGTLDEGHDNDIKSWN